MPLMFSTVCELLQSLDNDLSRKRHQKGSQHIVNDWFNRNQDILNNYVDLTALLSTLLPERRTDRVYNIQLKRLEKIVVKSLGLGSSRTKQLRRWEIEGAGVDFADCIEAILKTTPNVVEQDVTVEETDSTLHQLAAGVAFSSPLVQSSLWNSKPPTRLAGKKDDPLLTLFRKLTARDAKWFSRLILKNFLPVVIPEHLVYSRCHPLLPTVMRIHDNFIVATRLLTQQNGPNCVLAAETELSEVPRLVKPQIGVKVGRQTWLKARSIKHCIEMGGGLMSCEEKVDGEYCQIHVDLTKGRNGCIQIFSKSGKDSTLDRWRLHRAIRSSLRIGTESCKFKNRCILEGEMVVWSDTEKRILAFEKIRKHVKRSGRYIGTDSDSPPRDWERPMIVYFDVLLVDDQSMLNVRHSERRRRLSAIVQCQAGEAALVRSKTINFTSRIAATELQQVFASCLSKRQEGLVLKPDEPYFSFGPGKRKYASCCIKLKKGYIKNCGEIGDIAAIGARYDGTRAKILSLPDTKYTHFYLGCLLNKDSVIRFDARPRFKVINEVEPSATMLEQFRRHVFPVPVPLKNSAFDLEATPGIVQEPGISTVFKEPPVFEITCFSFHKESNTDFWSPRFPYVSKIHSDRSWKDCLGFTELQELAECETKAPEQEDSQEIAHWLQVLEGAESKRWRENVDLRSQSTTATLTSNGAEETTPQCSPVELPRFSREAHCKTALCASNGTISPPTSSEIQPSRQPSPIRRFPEPRSPRKRQRSQTPSPHRSKYRKSLELPAEPNRSSPNEHGLRQPLEGFVSASSSQGNILPCPRPHISACQANFEQRLDVENIRPEPVIPLRLVSRSYHSTADVSDPQKPPIKRILSAKASFSDVPVQRPTCHYVGGTCALANYLVLLSPCVASMPWLTEDLLPSHGLTAVFKDIPSWVAFSTPPDGIPRQQRRVVLVERHRTEATRTFLEQLQAEPLRRRNGEPEIAIAYDWRLLEAITNEENVKASTRRYATRQKAGTGAQARELGKKHYIGLC